MPKRTHMEVVWIDLKKSSSLSTDMAQTRFKWKTEIMSPTPTWLEQGFDDDDGHGDDDCAT